MSEVLLDIVLYHWAIAHYKQTPLVIYPYFYQLNSVVYSQYNGHWYNCCWYVIYLCYVRDAIPDIAEILITVISTFITASTYKHRLPSSSGAIMSTAECRELGSCVPSWSRERQLKFGTQKIRNLKSINMVKQMGFLGMLSPNLASILC